MTHLTWYSLIFYLYMRGVGCSVSVGQQFPMSVWGPLREPLRLNGRFVGCSTAEKLCRPWPDWNVDNFRLSIGILCRLLTCAANAAFTPIHAVYQTWKRIEREKCCIEDAGTVFYTHSFTHRFFYCAEHWKLGRWSSGHNESALRPHAPNASIANGDEKRLEPLF